MKAFLLLIVGCMLLSQIGSAQKTGRFDYGFALEFNVGLGRNHQYVQLPQLDKLGGPMTFEVWVYPAGTSGSIYEFGNGYKSEAVRLRWDASTANVIFELGVSNKVISLAAGPVRKGQWSMVTVVIQKSGIPKIYINGKDTGVTPSTTTGWSLPNCLTRKYNYIGKDSNNAYFSGDIDEVVIWSTPLSPNEIAIRKVLTGNETNVLHYWNFDQGIGYKAADLGRSNMTGILGGGVIADYPYWVVPNAVNSAVCSATGDPHITTFDGYLWHFQGSGEYWLLQSGDGAIAIQVRQDQWIGNPGACVNIGFAFRAYGDTVSVDADFRRHPGVLYMYVNGQRTTASSMYLPNSGVIITYTAYADHLYWEIDAPFLWTMKVISYYSQYSNIWLRIYGDRYNTKLGGECGNWNGDTSDDCRNIHTGILYGWSNFWNFGMSLKVPWSDSFFNNENQYVEVVPVLDIEFKDPVIEATANKLCKDRRLVGADFEWNCMFDLAVTGDIHLAFAAAQSTYEQCLQNAALNPSLAKSCTPPCPNFCSLHGTCSNGVCKCDPGYTARDCSIQKQYWCNKATINLNSQVPTEIPFYPVESRSNVVDYYAYNTRYGSSAYTGYEISNSTILLLHHYQPNIDSSISSTSFVMISDRWEDGSGGSLSARFVATDLSGKPVTSLSLKVQDDPNDNIKWNQNSGSGSASWNWDDCCTDGLALGYLPQTTGWNLKIDIDTSSAKGIDQYFLGSRAPSGLLDLFKLDKAAVSQGIMLSRGWCYDNCGEYSNCTGCLDQPGCGWCEDVGVCSAGGPVGPATFRCRQWRWSKDPAVSRIIDTNTDYPLDPSTINVFLAPNDPIKAHIYVNMPDYDDMPVDILLLQDLSYSNFNPYLKFLESIYRTVYLNTRAIYPLARFGLASFSDKPVLPYGAPSKADHVYYLRLAMTSNSQKLQSAITTMTIADGLDFPQAQLEALLQVSQRVTEAGFALTAKKLVVLITKSPFHTPTGTFSSPNNGDGVVTDTEDYPSVDQVRVALLTANVVPIFVVPGDVAGVYRDLVNTWGFGYVSVMSSGIENLGQQILEGINFVCTSPYLTPNTKGFIQGSSPQIYSGIGPGIRVNFDVTLLDNGAPYSTIVSPGYGSANITAVRDDLPTANPVTSYTLNEDTQVIAYLTGYTVYNEDLTAKITALPTRGRLFQCVGGNMGDAITTAGAALTDPLKRVFYVPAQHTHGMPLDQLTYILSDECDACSRPVNVTFYVIHVNHPPVASSTTPLQTLEDTPLLVTLNGTDPDAEDTLTSIVNVPQDGLADMFQYVSGGNNIGPKLTPQNNKLTDPNFRAWFVPRANLNGQSGFSYYVSDSYTTSTPFPVSVYIVPVNDPPVATDGNVTTLENGQVELQFIGSDIDSYPLTAIVQALPTRGALYQWGSDNVTLGVNISTVPTVVTDPNGRVWYVPNRYAHGLPLEDVPFTVSDGSLTDNGVVKVWVIHVNNPPVAFTSTSTADEDTDQNISLTGFDPDTATEGDKLYAFLCSLPTQGKVFQFDGTPITSADVNVNGTWSVTDSLNRIRYSPAPNGNCGQCTQAFDSLRFQMADRTPTAADRLLSHCTNVDLYVLPVNDPPQAATITPFNGVEDTDGIVLLQCTDVDNEQVTFKLAPLATRGTVYQAGPSGNTWVSTNISVGLNGTVGAAYWDGNLLSTAYVVFRSPLNANGWPYDKFGYHCEDAVSSSNNFLIDVNVQAVNDPPVVNAVANITIDEDTVADFVINGTDVESPVVFPEIVRSPGSTSTIGFLYQVLPDNTTGSPIFVTNNKPTPVTSPNYLVRFKPAQDQNDVTVGSPYVTILFGVNDGNLSSIPKGISIFVRPVNDAPWATAYSPMGNDEDQDSILPLTAYDVDNTQSELSVYIDVLPTRGTLFQVDYYSGQATERIVAAGTKVTDPQRRVLYRPPPNACNIPPTTPYDGLMYHVEDLQPLKSASKLVQIMVYPVNDPPVPVPLGQLIGYEDSYVVVKFNATDVDNTFSELKFRASVGRGTLYQYDLSSPTAPIGAQLPADGTVGPTSWVVFVPDKLTYSSLSKDDLTEYATIQWSVSDPLGLAGNSQAGVVIIHVNHPPVATTEAFNVTEDADPVLQKLEGTDPDKIDTILYSELVVQPSKGRVYRADGTLRVIAIGEQFQATCLYQPFPLTWGWDSLVYRVWDGYTYSQNKTVNIYITHVNHPPVAFVNTHVTGVQDTDVGPILLSGSDPDGDTPLRASVHTLPTKGSLFQVNRDGSRGDQIKGPAVVTYMNLVYYHQTTPGEYSLNYDSFTFTVNDLQNTNQSESDPAAVVVDLTPANRPPTADAETPVTTWENVQRYIVVSGTPGDGPQDQNQTITFFITTLPTRGILSQTNDSNNAIKKGDQLTDPSVYYMPPLYAYSENDTQGNPLPYARFGFTVFDSLGASSPEFFVDIIVLHVNQVPVSVPPGDITTLEDTPVSFHLNSTDVENDPTHFIITFVPDISVGNFTYQSQLLHINDTIPSPADVTFSPAKDKNGLSYTTFMYTASDLWYRTAQEIEHKVLFNVLAVNDPPTLTLLSPPLAVRPFQRVFPELQFNTSLDGDGFHGILLVALGVGDVDADQNDLTFNIRTTKGLSITQMYIPFPNGTGLVEKRGNPITFTGTLDQLNNGLSKLQLERFDSNLGDELMIISLNDNGHSGLGGPMIANATYYLREIFQDNTSGGNQAAITGAAVAGGVGAIAAALGAYKLLKKKNLIDSADPWESEDAFQSTIDNPLYNHDQNANVLYEPPPSGTA